MVDAGTLENATKQRTTSPLAGGAQAANSPYFTQWIEAQPVGAYAYPVRQPDGSITNRLVYFSPAKNKRYAKTVNSMVADGVSIPIVPEHTVKAVPVSANDHDREKAMLAGTVGFVRGGRVQPGGTLELLVEVRDPVWIPKMGVTVLHCSPGFRDWYRTGDGKKWTDVVAHLALTHYPVDHHKSPIMPMIGTANVMGMPVVGGDGGLGGVGATFMSLTPAEGGTLAPKLVPIWEVPYSVVSTQCLVSAGTSYVFKHADGKQRFGTRKAGLDWLRSQYSKQFSLNLDDANTIWMAVMHAPVGGVQLQGRFYRGGMFIPNSVVEAASPAEKAKIKDARAAHETERAFNAKANMQDAESVHDAILRHAGEHGAVEQSPDDKRDTLWRWDVLKAKHGEKGALEQVVTMAANEAKELQGMGSSPHNHHGDNRARQLKRRLAAYAAMVRFASDPGHVEDHKAGAAPAVAEKAPSPAVKKDQFVKDENGVEWPAAAVYKSKNGSYVIKVTPGMGPTRSPVTGGTYQVGGEMPIRRSDAWHHQVKGHEILKDILDGKSTKQANEPVPEPKSAENEQETTSTGGEEPKESAKSTGTGIQPLVDAGLASSDITSRMKAKYGQTVADLHKRLSPKAQEHLAANVKGFKFHEDSAALTESLIERSPDMKAKLGRAKAGGAYSKKTGELHLNGGSTLDGKKLTQDHVYAHEFAHAIDGPEHTLSKNDAWREAWKAEAPLVSKYATKTPQEGFAEFGRLVYASGLHADQLNERYPKMMAHWQGLGLVPDAGSAQTATPAEGGTQPQLAEGRSPQLPDVFEGPVDTPDAIGDKALAKRASGESLEEYLRAIGGHAAHDTIRDYAKQLHEQDKHGVDEHNEIVRAAMSGLTSHYGKSFNKNHPDLKKDDPAEIKGLDTVSSELAGQYPHVFGGDAGYGGDADNTEASAKAMDKLHGMLQEGIKPSPELRDYEDQAVQEWHDNGRPLPEGAEPEQADTSFDFGANADEPGASDDSGGSGTPSSKGDGKRAKRKPADNASEPPPPAPSPFASTPEEDKAAWEKFAAVAKSKGGLIVPPAPGTKTPAGDVQKSDGGGHSGEERDTGALLRDKMAAEERRATDAKGMAAEKKRAAGDEAIKAMAAAHKAGDKLKATQILNDFHDKHKLSDTEAVMMVGKAKELAKKSAKEGGENGKSEKPAREKSVHEQVADHFGIPVEAAKDALSTDFKKLQSRDNDNAPNNAGEKPFTDYEKHAPGTVRAASWQNDPKEAYIDYMTEHDPKELVTSEAEDGIKKRDPSYAKYVEWAKAGHEPPPISTSKSSKEGSKVVSSNRRRVLAAQEAGVDKIKAWHGPENPHTGNPLKYGDVIEHAKKLGWKEPEKPQEAATPTPAQIATGDIPKAASNKAQSFDEIYDHTKVPVVTNDEIESGNWDTFHPGLGSELALRKSAAGMKGINGEEYGIREHSPGKWQMVSRKATETTASGVGGTPALDWKPGHTESADEALARVKASPNQPKDRNWDKYADNFGVEGKFHHVEIPTEELKKNLLTGHLRRSNSVNADTVSKKVESGDRNPVLITKEPGKGSLVVDGNHSLQAAIDSGDKTVKAIVSEKSPFAPDAKGTEAQETKSEPVVKAEDNKAAAAEPAKPADSNPHAPGTVHDIPAAGGRFDFKLKIHPSKTEGKVGVGYADHGGDQAWKTISESNAKRFVDDLQGKVDVPGESGNEHIDAVTSGKSKFLHRGNDAIVHEVGDKIVKTPTVVGFHPFNPGEKHPTEVNDKFEKQAETQNKLAESIPGIQKLEMLKHGKGADARPFTVSDKLEIPKSLTADQLDKVRHTLDRLHDAGYVVGDEIQVGLKDGKPYIYDLGNAQKARDEQDYGDESAKFARFAEEMGHKDEPALGMHAKLQKDHDDKLVKKDGKIWGDWHDNHQKEVAKGIAASERAKGAWDEKKPQPSAADIATGDFMKPAAKRTTSPTAPQYSADDLDELAGQSFTNDKGLTVDVVKDEDGTWSVGKKYGLTKQGAANALNDHGAVPAQGLFAPDVTAQRIAEGGTQSQAKKPKLEWAPPAKSKSADSDATALPGMADTHAPGMFGAAKTEAEAPEEEGGTPTATDIATGKPSASKWKNNGDGTYTSPNGTVWRKAKAGGEESPVNGKHFAGGALMPIHGLHQKVEKQPAGDGLSGGESKPKDDGRRKGNGEPKQIRTMTPEEIEEEKQRREEAKKWSEIKSGPLGLALPGLGERPHAIKGGVKNYPFVDFAKKIGPEGLKKLREHIEPLAMKQESERIDADPDSLKGNPFLSHRKEDITKEQSLAHFKESIEDWAKTNSNYYKKKDLKAFPDAPITQQWLNHLIENKRDVAGMHDIHKFLEGLGSATTPQQIETSGKETLQKPGDAKSVRARAIAELSREDTHPIEESKKYKGSDGNYYGVGGVPWGVKLDMNDSKSMGWVARHKKQGTTFGTQHPSKEAAEAHYKNLADKKVDDFHSQLMKMDDGQLDSQEKYWRGEAEKKARLEGKPAPKWDTTAKDNAVVNLPLDKRGGGSLDSQIDKNLKEQKKTARVEDKARLKSEREERAEAKALIEKHGEAVVARTIAKHGGTEKEAKEVLNHLAWKDPKKVVAMLSQEGDSVPPAATPAPALTPAQIATGETDNLPAKKVPHDEQDIHGAVPLQPGQTPHDIMGDGKTTRQQHYDNLMEKAKAYDAKKAGFNITDATPKGYGPGPQEDDDEDGAAKHAAYQKYVDQVNELDKLEGGHGAMSQKDYESAVARNPNFHSVLENRVTSARQRKAENDAHNKSTEDLGKYAEHEGLVYKHQHGPRGDEWHRVEGFGFPLTHDQMVKHHQAGKAKGVTAGRAAEYVQGVADRVKAAADDKTRAKLDSIEARARQELEAERADKSKRTTIVDNPPPGGWKPEDKVPVSEDAVRHKAAELAGHKAHEHTTAEWEKLAGGHVGYRHARDVHKAISEGKDVSQKVLEGTEGAKTVKAMTDFDKRFKKEDLDLIAKPVHEQTEDEFVRRRSISEQRDAHNYSLRLQKEIDDLGPKAGKKKAELETQRDYWKKRAEDDKPSSANEDSRRKQYRETIKKAISKGQVTDPRIIAQHPEFKTARNARERYEKGRHTSFANKSIAVDYSTQEEHGYKAKRQDGKELTERHRKELATGVKEVEAAVGSLKDAFKHTDVTLAHTNGTFPFLSTAGGLYHPSEKTVTSGIQVGPFKLKSLAHELGHWLDHEGGKALGWNGTAYHYSPASRGRGKAVATTAMSDRNERFNHGHAERTSLFDMAKQSMTDEREVRQLVKTPLSEAKNEEEKAEIQKAKVQLGPYYSSPTEIFARLFEQYVGDHHEHKEGESYDSNYLTAPGYWNEATWKRLKPLVKKEIDRRLEAIHSAIKKKPEVDMSLLACLARHRSRTPQVVRTTAMAIALGI